MSSDNHEIAAALMKQASTIQSMQDSFADIGNATISLSNSLERELNEVKSQTSAMVTMLSKLLAAVYKDKYIVLELSPLHELDSGVVYEEYLFKKTYIGRLISITDDTNYGDVSYTVHGTDGVKIIPVYTMKYIDFAEFDDENSAKLYAEVSD